MMLQAKNTCKQSSIEFKAPEIPTFHDLRPKNPSKAELSFSHPGPDSASPTQHQSNHNSFQSVELNSHPKEDKQQKNSKESINNSDNQSESLSILNDKRSNMRQSSINSKNNKTMNLPKEQLFISLNDDKEEKHDGFIKPSENANNNVADNPSSNMDSLLSDANNASNGTDNPSNGANNASSDTSISSSNMDSLSIGTGIPSVNSSVSTSNPSHSPNPSSWSSNDPIVSKSTAQDFKGKLIQLCLQNKISLNISPVEQHQHPILGPCFMVTAHLSNGLEAIGYGYKKKDAEREVCQLLLHELRLSLPNQSYAMELLSRLSSKSNGNFELRFKQVASNEDDEMDKKLLDHSDYEEGEITTKHGSSAESLEQGCIECHLHHADVTRGHHPECHANSNNVTQVGCMDCHVNSTDVQKTLNKERLLSPSSLSAFASSQVHASTASNTIHSAHSNSSSDLDNHNYMTSSIISRQSNNHHIMAILKGIGMPCGNDHYGTGRTPEQALSACLSSLCNRCKQAIDIYTSITTQSLIHGESQSIHTSKPIHSIQTHSQSIHASKPTQSIQTHSMPSQCSQSIHSIHSHSMSIHSIRTPSQSIPSTSVDSNPLPMSLISGTKDICLSAIDESRFHDYSQSDPDFARTVSLIHERILPKYKHSNLAKEFNNAFHSNASDTKARNASNPSNIISRPHNNIINQRDNPEYWFDFNGDAQNPLFLCEARLSQVLLSPKSYHPSDPQWAIAVDQVLEDSLDRECHHMIIGRGKGRSKKLAKQNALYDLLMQYSTQYRV